MGDGAVVGSAVGVGVDVGTGSGVDAGAAGVRTGEAVEVGGGVSVGAVVADGSPSLAWEGGGVCVDPGVPGGTVEDDPTLAVAGVAAGMDAAVLVAKTVELAPSGVDVLLSSHDTSATTQRVAMASPNAPPRHISCLPGFLPMALMLITPPMFLVPTTPLSRPVSGSLLSPPADASRRAAWLGLVDWLPSR